MRVAPHLLVSGDASVHGGVDDSVQAHAERVDVAVMLPVLVLADQGAQLLGLILHHVNGVLQGAHLHLAGGAGEGRTQHVKLKTIKKENVRASFYPPPGVQKKIDIKPSGVERPPRRGKACEV